MKWRQIARRLANSTGVRRAGPFDHLRWGKRGRTGDAVDVVISSPHAYQVDELAPVAHELERNGASVAFLDHSAEGDSPAAERARSSGLDVITAEAYAGGGVTPGALLVRSDSEPNSRRLIEHGKKAGVTTIALSHPVINFRRHPSQFQLPDFVLSAGAYTADRLDRPGVMISGFPFYDRYLQAPQPHRQSSLVLINVALPRGLERSVPGISGLRREWVDECLEAVDSLGLEAVVSVHPRDSWSTEGWPVRHDKIEAVLPKAAALISPPSSVILTAMAMGIPVLCHQCEPVRNLMADTFDQPLGAFDITVDAAGITQALSACIERQGNYRALAEPFFRRHVAVSPKRSMAQRTAAMVMDLGSVQ